MTKILSSILVVLAYYFVLGIFSLIGSYPRSPAAPVRLGNILWHSSASANRDTVVYCYYPSGNTSRSGIDSEVPIKKTSNIDQCQDWYGIAIINDKE